MFMLDLSRQPKEHKAKSSPGILPLSRREDGLVIRALGSLVALGEPFGFSMSQSMSSGWEEHRLCSFLSL